VRSQRILHPEATASVAPAVTTPLAVIRIPITKKIMPKFDGYVIHNLYNHPFG